MNLNWQNFLAAAGARFAEQRLLDFGDAAAERLAARDATVLAPLTHLGMIEVSGNDAATFLHNQFTSDINHLPVDKAQHSAWCSAKGRMLASFLLFRQGTRLQLQLAAGLLPTIIRRLRCTSCAARSASATVLPNAVCSAFRAHRRAMRWQRPVCRNPTHRWARRHLPTAW
ncbi:MAG TPA: hypothetical protein PKY22_05255 [Accumulibacter sp.]|nr:hypothetical protein [Accumulibacter sp.]